jgi:acetyl-CoA acetyltransferase
MYFLAGDITETAAVLARDMLWRNAGLGPEDVDITAAYDAFTFTSLLLLEDYGFCAKGDGGDYVSDGTIRLGGRRPNNTSGGLLCEGYANGMNLVIENVRQLRHEADDPCPCSGSGRRLHSHDHGPDGHCRQVRGAEVAANLGWGNIAMGSALVLARG